MAKPAFIYAFDNLGPDRFTELCGLLLASRYQGFLLGGVGPDGGVDGELDQVLGIWQPETVSPLLNEIIQPGEKVVFQFKHKVTARVGQAQTRTKLLNLYKCSTGKRCELHRRLVSEETPSAYVLVTNVEVNSPFRSKFIQLCKSEQPNIEHYQVIGLDELETWVTMERQLRHLYFPTIFGPPRFNLEVKLSCGINLVGYGYDDQPMDFTEETEILIVSILNTGTVTSYIRSVVFSTIVDGNVKGLALSSLDNKTMERLNPELKKADLQPGRKRDYKYPLEAVRLIKEMGREVFPVEVLVYDEIDNVYMATIPENIRGKIAD